MELKRKIKQVILCIICGIFLITAIFLGAVAAVYSVSGGTPNIFGTYLYLVKTDAFNELKNGTALIAEEVHAMEIQPWAIVIFNLENGKPALAEIRSGELIDGVYRFEAVTENGAQITLSQSQIVAKGTSYSDAWGAVISFASSPLGVLLVAVVPCLIIIVVEITKFIRKTLPQPEIETVKKQLEVPTYTPESGRANAVNAYKASSASLDDSIGLYDAQVRRSTGIERIDRNDVLEISSQEAPLFLGPKRKPVTIQKRATEQSAPLSQKKLNEAIAAAKAERELGIQREKAVKEIQKNRSAAIAAEKEQEDYLRAMRKTQQTAAAAPSPARSEAAKNTSFAANKASGPIPEPISPLKPAASQTTPLSSEKKQDTTKIKKPEARKKEFVPEFKPSYPPQKEKTAPVPPISAGDEDNVKQYTPRKNNITPVPHATTSIPRLDELLNEDVDGDSYNIDDILASLDKR